MTPTCIGCKKDISCFYSARFIDTLAFSQEGRGGKARGSVLHHAYLVFSITRVIVSLILF